MLPINVIQDSFKVIYPNQALQPENNTFLTGLVRGSWILMGLLVTVQCIRYPNLINLIAIAYVAFAWLFNAGIFLKPAVLKNYPLSSFLIIGFTCTQFYFPLLFTTIEGKPLINNLQLPQEVFFHSILALLILICMHALYRSITYQRITKPSRGPKTFRKLGFFEPPSDLQVWLMGMFGLGAMFYTSFILKDGGNTEEGVVGKVMDVLMSFTYAPFFIPFGKLYGQKHAKTKGLATKLLLFTVLLFLISIGRNSRGSFMIGFTSLGFAFGLGLMLGIIKARLFSIKYALIASVAIWLLTGPFSDLGNAMVVVRHQRNDIPKSEFIKLTLDAFKDKKLLRDYVMEVKTNVSDWDEKYLDNIFLARFCNIKFNDASLVFASQIPRDNDEVRIFSINRIWSTFPQPILSILHPNMDKIQVNGMSFGDCLRYQVNKSHYNLGSYVTGHLSGTGMAAFGWWYLLILAISILPVYFLMDIFHVRRFVFAGPRGQYAGIERRFSLCVLLNLNAIFQFLPSESVVSILQYLIRGWFQMVFLYLILFYLTRTISRLLKTYLHL